MPFLVAGEGSAASSLTRPLQTTPRPYREIRSSAGQTSRSKNLMRTRRARRSWSSKSFGRPDCSIPKSR